VHLSVKYSKPERMGTTLWTVGRDRHFGQRGGPFGAVDAGSDITAYSLDWEGNSVSWHLVPLKERPALKSRSCQTPQYPTVHMTETEGKWTSRQMLGCILTRIDEPDCSPKEIFYRGLVHGMNA